MPAHDEGQVMERIWRRGDVAMLGMLAFHAAAAVCFAFFYDTWFPTCVVGAASLGMFLLAWRLQPGTFLTRCIAGIALQAFVALHIYQLHGLAEMHFFFFTAFAAMLVYQDWACMWPGALLIIAQHIGFAVLHNFGTDVFFFEGYVSATKLCFHFGIALLHVGLCNLWAILLRGQTLRDAAFRAELDATRRRAELASAAKTTFLGDMSHELRTPMSGVLSMTELLLQRDLPTDLRESLDVVRSSALALVDIVNDALDLARVEAGKLELVAADFDLRRVCEEVAELLGPRAQQHGVELVLRWQPGGPTLLRGDAGRWRQVLVNLAGNAIKFAGGGHVLIDVAVQPAAVGASTAVVIRVDDSGKGIPPEVLSRLFQRFEQADATTYGRHGGSGLGLAISRELVQRMQGTLTAHSVPGAGATFVVRAELEVAGATEPPPACHERALLVGTHDLTLGVLAEQLEHMGAEVVVVADAAQAQRAIADASTAGRPFQLLLTEPLPGTDLRELPADMRRIALGDAPAATGERIVCIHRHQELARVVCGDPQHAPAHAVQPQFGLRVLVAEDDAVCAKVATRMLQVLGCEVAHVGDGAAAIARCRTEPFDLVLMDCRMPGMDGIEATRRLRRDGPPVRIVMLSANSLPAERQACLDAGADEFLGKPVQLVQLRDALARSRAALPAGR